MSGKFTIGDRVFQEQDGGRLYGEIVQAEVAPGVPRFDDQGHPVLVVISDDVDVYENLDGWSLA
jgi:hypothetical protein